ncbi:hypothetical protein BC629DRAFT_1293531 [Irpex lacteus]|nr:hypothetical protein BC629DRAFT_1293531 [Irpex lacteus]
MNGEDIVEDDEDEDGEFRIPQKRAPRLSNEEKTCVVLKYMRGFNKLSLRNFLETVFTSHNANVHSFTGHFLKDEGAMVELLDNLWEQGRRTECGDAMVEWVVGKAADECDRECSYLTDRASAGPYSAKAEALKVPVNAVKVTHVRDFRYPELLARYERVMPHLQRILKATIGKDGEPVHVSSRNPDHGRTTIVSMILNIRSRQTNYHPLVNTFLLWQTGASKRLIQILNHLGFCMSYDVQGRAITALTKDTNRVSREAAQDEDSAKELAYDNYNWRKVAREVSALHGSIQHDQVSAMLVILKVPSFISARTVPEIMDIRRFDERFGARHKVPMAESLQSISPSFEDHRNFRMAIILHIQEILVHDLKPFSRFCHSLRGFEDPKAIIPHVTQRHFLPTFEQEQGSTRGNMVVLSHYLEDVLQIPKSHFERQAIVVLGDRLTTARDRAAQDQRAVDRSTDRSDHLSSLVLSTGMMHQCLNMIMAIARVTFGDTSSNDNISLLTLRNKLPNREGLNLKKVDFYAWLRFLEVVLRALIVAAVYAHLETKQLSDIVEATRTFTLNDFPTLCTDLADNFVLPSVESLEQDGTKCLDGDTECAHAVIITHALMTLREMRHAIKHGHPTRMLRMLKFWTPMFYAGGSYNYSNEDMELLHNILGEWPEDAADIILAGTPVNTSGRDNGFKEGDLDVEHLNKIIKARAHGANATPNLLERITPALGQVRHLTEQVSNDLGLEELKKYHASVRQDKDVQILVKHLVDVSAFCFTTDTPSNHSMGHMFYDGQQKLGGESGGHAKHLARHKLRLRKRHGISDDDDEQRDVDTRVSRGSRFTRD